MPEPDSPPSSGAAVDQDAAAQEVLGLLGLAQTELRAYQFLLRVGAATPTTVARETGQSRGRIYETLRLLVQRGLVREEPSRPIRYQAVPLAEVVALAMAETSRQAQALRAAYMGLPRTPQPATGLPAPTKPSDISTYTGRRSVVAQIRRMLAQAQKVFVLAGGGGLADRIAASPDLLADLRDAHGRGVHVELRLWAPSASPAVDGLRRRLEDSGPRLVCTEDGEVPLMVAATEAGALFIAVQPDDGAPQRGDDVAVFTGSDPFARSALSWLSATSPPQAAAAAETRTPSLAAPLPDLDTRIVSERYLEALSRAESEVIAMGPRGWARFLAEDWQHTVGVYAAAHRRGVRFRGLSADGPDAHEMLQGFAALWEIRQASWVPTWLVIVDRTHLFQALRPEGAPPGTSASLRYSDDAAELRFYLSLFERLWGESKPLAKASLPVAKS